MANSKYWGVTKKDIEAGKLIGDEIQRRDIGFNLPFYVTSGPFNSMKIWPNGDTKKDEISLGRVICDLARALEEVECAFEAVTGKEYKNGHIYLPSGKYQEIADRVREIWNK